MDKTIVNRMSLYDILTLIIPGSMLVAVIYIGAYPWIKDIDFSWIINLALFGVMFLIGLILKTWALEQDKKKFDQNMDAIREKYADFAKDTNHEINCEKKTWDEYCSDYYFAVEKYSHSKIAILEAQVAFLRTIRYTMSVLSILCLLICLTHTVAFVVIHCSTLPDNYTLQTTAILTFIGMVLCCGLCCPKFLINKALKIQKKSL